jgi:MoaA/NifB/PqqE/SkfB family radical SAM enzyme
MKVVKIKNTICLLKNVLLSKVYGTPYKINFMVTAACNSRCTTCNIWKDFQAKPSIVKKEMTFEEIVKIFKNLPKTVTWLSLTGGEPFLRKDLLKIIKAAIKYIPNLKLMGIPSNGLSQARILEVIRKLTKTKHPDIIITFSIDGPEELHDKIRGIKGAFRKTWDTYIKARRLVVSDKDFQVAIETTISSKNIKVLSPFMKKLLERNHKIAVTVAHDAYLYRNEDDKSLSPRKNINELKSLIRLFNRHLSFFNPQTIIERQYLRKIPVFIMNPSRRVIPCEASKSSFALDSMGNILPCFMWGNKLGNLRNHDYDIKKIWASKKFVNVRKAIKENKCPNCWTPCEAYQSIFWAVLKLRLLLR